MEMVVCQEGFFIMLDGVEERVSVGDVLAADHPIVRSTPPERWAPLEVMFEVETTTAEPGEKRAARARVSKSTEDDG